MMLSSISFSDPL